MNDLLHGWWDDIVHTDIGTEAKAKDSKDNDGQIFDEKPTKSLFIGVPKSD